MSKESFWLDVFQSLGLLDSEPPNAMVLYRIARDAFISKNIDVAEKYFRLNKIVNNCVMPYQAKIGEGTKAAYGGIGILIHRDAQIGNNCSLNQAVAIVGGRNGVPVIDDYVFISPGAKLIGKINVATGTIIGLNAVVTKSTEPFCIYAGIPARCIAKIDAHSIYRYQALYNLKTMEEVQEFLLKYQDLMAK